MLAGKMTKEYTVENLTRLPSYTPNREKFNSYTEWRQINTSGTYADYREWVNSNQAN